MVLIRLIFRSYLCMSKCTLGEVILSYNIRIYIVWQTGANIHLRAHIDAKLRVVH